MIKIQIYKNFMVMIVVCNVILNFVLFSIKAEDIDNKNIKSRIEVEVEGLESNEGKVYFVLHKSDTFTKENLNAKHKGKHYLEKNFVKHYLRKTEEINDMKCKWISGPIDCGTYAVIVLHDENGNGIYDRKRKWWSFGFKVPTEKMGVSNYKKKLRGYLGSKDFNKAKITLEDTFDTVVLSGPRFSKALIH